MTAPVAVSIISAANLYKYTSLTTDALQIHISAAFYIYMGLSPDCNLTLIYTTAEMYDLTCTKTHRTYITKSTGQICCEVSAVCSKNRVGFIKTLGEQNIELSNLKADASELPLPVRIRDVPGVHSHSASG